MNLLILGATGPTGRHVVNRAIAAGDTVTVLARRPEALADLADQVNVGPETPPRTRTSRRP
ncbi:NAD(P)H-binding protein [Streptomyces mirabilis]|uniref:NAD(P)H-binding protein n=1 Tax=Streptomyces mirabilis TaxID=68239 RepID=UPI00339DD38F